MPVRSTPPIVLRPESISSADGSPAYYGSTQVSADERWAASYSATNGSSAEEIQGLRLTITDLESGSSKLADLCPSGMGSLEGFTAFGPGSFIAPHRVGYTRDGPSAILNPATGAWSAGPSLPTSYGRAESIATYGTLYSNGGGLAVALPGASSAVDVPGISNSPLALADAKRERWLAWGYGSDQRMYAVEKTGAVSDLGPLPFGGGFASIYDEDHFIVQDYLTYKVYDMQTLTLEDSFTTDTYPEGEDSPVFLTLTPELLAHGTLAGIYVNYQVGDPYDGGYEYNWYYSTDLGRTWVADPAFSVAWNAPPPSDAGQLSLAKISPSLGGWATPQDSASRAFGFRRSGPEVHYFTLENPPEPEPEPLPRIGGLNTGGYSTGVSLRRHAR